MSGMRTLAHYQEGVMSKEQDIRDLVLERTKLQKLLETIVNASYDYIEQYPHLTNVFLKD